MWATPIVTWMWLWLWLGCTMVQSQSAVFVRRTRTPHDGSPSTGEPSNITQEWFTQQLDHFNPTDDNQWEQRYWVNPDHYRRGAPVFLYVSGESEETGFSYDLSEPWEEFAVLHSALMFKLEHRFYGESQPTGGNLTLEDLQYLSTAQVLADLANFIVAMNRQYDLPPGTRWIAFGCSYSASLAAWLRYKYPHLVYAAVASSAPLLMKVNFPEYYNAVGEAVMKFYGNITQNNTMGIKCLETFKQANKEVDDLVKTPQGLNLTIEYFGLNDSLELDYNDTLEGNNRVVHDVFSWLLTYISTAIQENVYDDATETWGIERFCDTLLNESLGGIVKRYGDIYKIIYSETPKENETNRQWNYQLCSEFGVFQTLERENSILGDYIKEEYYFEDCKEEFGDRFTEEFIRQRVDRTNTRYGGLELDATRVLYVHGSLDPWLPLGLNHTRNPLSPVIVIEETLSGNGAARHVGSYAETPPREEQAFPPGTEAPAEPTPGG